MKVTKTRKKGVVCGRNPGRRKEFSMANNAIGRKEEPTQGEWQRPHKASVFCRFVASSKTRKTFHEIHQDKQLSSSATSFLFASLSTLTEKIENPHNLRDNDLKLFESLFLSSSTIITFFFFFFDR